jgi:hypothetical protein
MANSWGVLGKLAIDPASVESRTHDVGLELDLGFPPELFDSWRRRRLRRADETHQRGSTVGGELLASYWRPRHGSLSQSGHVPASDTGIGCRTKGL